MKKIILLILAILTLSCCNNDDDDQTKSPIDQLPPATQTGAQTFGCLINGVPFVPPNFGNNAPSAFYQFVNGAYTLGVSAGTGGGTELKSINLGCLDVPLLEEANYALLEFSPGNYFGEYRIGGGFIYSGSSHFENSGTLTITNFDTDNFIISGLFNFESKDINTGELIQITDGRFDMNYTN